MKKWKKYLGASMAALILAGCTGVSGLVRKNLSDFSELNGNRSFGFGDMSFRINGDLDVSEKETSTFIYPVRGHSVPVLIVSKDDESYDWHKANSKNDDKLLQHLEEKSQVNGKVRKVSNAETIRLDSHEGLVFTYEIEGNRKDESLLSKNLEGNTIVYPVEDDVYNLTFVTYKEDSNKYNLETVLKEIRYEDIVDRKKSTSIQNEANQISVHPYSDEEERANFEKTKDSLEKAVRANNPLKAETCLKELNQLNETIEERFNSDFDQLTESVSTMQAGEFFNEQEIEHFNSLKNAAVPRTIDGLLSLQSRKSEIEALEESARARHAEEEAEKVRQAQEAAQAARSAESAPATGGYIGPGRTPDGGYYCKDGTTVSASSNPSAKGKANACYGHGGFAIN